MSHVAMRRVAAVIACLAVGCGESFTEMRASELDSYIEAAMNRDAEVTCVEVRTPRYECRVVVEREHDVLAGVYLLEQDVQGWTAQRTKGSSDLPQRASAVIP